jgi:hypothetical protein
MIRLRGGFFGSVANTRFRGSSRIWRKIGVAPSPLFFVSVASKGLRYSTSSLESTLVGIL